MTVKELRDALVAQKPPKAGIKPNCRPQVGNNLALHKTPKMQNKQPCFAPMQNN